MILGSQQKHAVKRFTGFVFVGGPYAAGSETITLNQPVSTTSKVESGLVYLTLSGGQAHPDVPLQLSEYLGLDTDGVSHKYKLIKPLTTLLNATSVIANEIMESTELESLVTLAQARKLGFGGITFTTGDGLELTIDDELRAKVDEALWNASQIQGVEVAIVAPTAGQVLFYDNVDSAWTPRTLLKGDVGLANVDNTSDLSKPISTATQAALDLKEGAIAAGTTAQYYRGDKTWQTLNRAAVGLANVDNTSDLNKPISTAAQAALDLKEGAIAAGTTAQYYRGDKTWATLDKNAVGLFNVDNTSDLSKPISTAMQAALDTKADKATTISAGTGLTGGGSLAANRTLSVNFGTAAGTVAEGNDSRILNGQTAFGWGNHASAGYLTNSTGDARYVRLAGSYDDPTWLTGLSWSKIDGTPTTIAGYGLTDAVPISRQLIVGDGLLGGGPLSANVNIDLDLDYLDTRYTSGFKQHTSVRAATTGNITLSGEQTIDGVAVVAGNRVLVKNQTAPEENGIYVASAGAWTRASDFNAPGAGNVEQGAQTFVEEGATQAKTGWALSTGGTIVVGTTLLSFIQYSGASSYTNGVGLTLTGTTFAARTTEALWNANQLQGRAMAATAPTSNQFVLWNGSAWTPTTLSAGLVPNLDASKITTGTLPIARGGTGLTALGTALQLIRVNSGGSALEYFTPTYISGNQTITLSGPVTGSGTTTIATTITDKAVTYAKIQDVTAARLLGRYAATSGAAQEITLGTGLTLNTSTGVLSPVVSAMPMLSQVLLAGNEATNNIILGATGNATAYTLYTRRNLSSVDYTAAFGVGIDQTALHLTMMQGDGFTNDTAAKKLIIPYGGTTILYSPDNGTTKHSILHTGNHTAGAAASQSLSGATVLRSIAFNSTGHFASLTTGTLTIGDLGAAPASGSANYIQNLGNAPSAVQSATSGGWVAGSFISSNALMVRRDGSNSVIGGLRLVNQDNTRGANFQLNADANPGMALWITNSSGTWAKYVETLATGHSHFYGFTYMPNTSGIRGTSTGTTNVAYLALYESNATTRQGYVGFATGTNNDLYISNDLLSSKVHIYSGGVAGLTVNSSGQTGLGTVTPAYRLQVVSNDTSGVVIQNADSSANTGAYARLYSNGIPTGVDRRFGGVIFGPYSGTTLYTGVQIEAFSAAAWTAGTSAPSYMRILVGQTASTSLTEVIRFGQDGTKLAILPAMSTAATTFLVSDGGIIKTRTAAQVLTDIGATGGNYVENQIASAQSANMWITGTVRTNLSFEVRPAAVGTYGYAFQAANGNLRWLMRTEVTETGSGNTGSDLVILRRADNGDSAGTAISIKRSDGSIHMPGVVKMGNASGIIGTSTGTANLAAMTFMESNNSTRQGYIGFGSSGNTHMHMLNDIGSVSITANAASSHIFLNASGFVYLDSTGSNTIYFNSNGIAAPSFTNRSAGTKLVLYPSISASAADYALGVESGAMWYSVANSVQSYKWYAGTTQIMRLVGDGSVQLSSMPSALASGGSYVIYDGTTLRQRSAANLLTDIGAAPNIGSTNYIHNQFTVDQAASMRISGAIRSLSEIGIYRNGSNSAMSTIHMRNASGTRGVNWQLNADATPGLAMWMTNSGGTWVKSLEMPATGALMLFPSSTETVRMVNNGAYISAYNSGNTTRTGYLQFNAANSTGLMVDIAQDLILGTNSTSRVWIKSYGHIGLGTSAPTEVVDVAGNLAVRGVTKYNRVVTNTQSAAGTQFWDSWGGASIFTDPEFRYGTNSCIVYNNSGGSGVQLFRANTAISGTTVPNTSGYYLRIRYTTGQPTSPNLGGFSAAFTGSINQTYVTRFRALIPTGYTLNPSMNAFGTNQEVFWLTDNTGTGKWEDYAIQWRYGTGGTISSVNFFNLAGPTGTTFDWYVCYFDTKNVTASPWTENAITTNFATGMPVMLYINTANTRLSQSASNQLVITTNSGNMGIGPQNASYAHFTTDRPTFYFDSPVNVDGTLTIHNTATSLSSTNLTLAAVNGNGIRFWGSDQYKIWMSGSTDGTWGGKITPSANDYNIYYKINGTGRGHSFITGDGVQRFQITPEGTWNNAWYRSLGNTGWINNTHGMGIWAEDSTYVKTYNNASFMSSGFKTRSILGLVGCYETTTTTSDQIIWTIGENWKTLAQHYGLGYHYGNEINGGDQHQVFIANAGVVGHRFGMNGDYRLTGWIYNAGSTGIRNASTGNLFFADGAYWNIGNNSASNQGIKFRVGAGTSGTIAGYVHANTSSELGFLNGSAAWIFRVTSTGAAQVYGGLTVTGAATVSTTLGVTGNATFGGTVTSTGGFFNSRAELKEIDGLYTGSALDLIDKLKVKSFKYKTRMDDNPTLGLIIEDIEESIDTKDQMFFLNSKKDSINQYSLTSIHTKAIQELRAENNELKRRIVELEKAGS